VAVAMTNLDCLIAEFCPDGVQYKCLGTVVQISNGKDHKLLADGDIVPRAIISKFERRIMYGRS